MADPLNLTLQFCEDLRTEDNGKPMMIGLIPRKIYFENGTEQTDKLRLWVITFITAQYEVERISAHLVVDHPASEETNIEMEFWSNIDRLEDTEEGDEWTVMIPAEVEDIYFEDGGEIRASLTVNDQTYTTAIRLRGASPDEAAALAEKMKQHTITG